MERRQPAQSLDGRQRPQVVTAKPQDMDPPEQASDAFKDVINAQQDKEQLMNPAAGSANHVVPRARDGGGAPVD